MATAEQEIENKYLHLVELHEASPQLQFLKEMDKNNFNIDQLPSVVKDMVQLAITRTAFPTVSSLAIANFVLSHLFGQLRPKINAPEYSTDVLGINTYSVVISRSGSSKDRTHGALTKAASKAIKYVEDKKKEEAESLAKAIYVKAMKKDNPDWDETSIIRDDWEPYVKPPIESVTDFESSRGGITSVLNQMNRSEYGVMSLYDSEFALSVQTSEKAVDIFKLISVLYDGGRSVAPSYKTEDAKEESVKDAYMNLLGVTSAAPFYERDSRVRKILVPLLMTSLARRTTVVFNTPEEEFSNEYVPNTLEEEERIEVENETSSRQLQLDIDNNLLKAVKSIDNNSTISMDEEAGKLYKTYRRYTKSKAKHLLLKDGDSAKGLELAGQAFKMFRIAAVWTMAQGKNIVDVTTLKAAIEFSVYTAEHLERFNKTLQLTEYELFVQDWQEGFLGNNVPIDTALSRGYIHTKQISKQALEAFLRPVNSKLTGEATVVYNEDSNCFIFTPLVKNTENLYSFRATKGISDDRPVPKELIDKSLGIFGKLLITDSSINPFIADTTKVVLLTVDKSIISMDRVNHYLADTKHWVATKQNTKDEDSFTIILPVNMQINKSDYKFIVMSIAEQFLLKVTPESCEPDYVHHGYNDAIQLTSNNSSQLFDVSGIITNAATSSTVPKLITKTSTKPTASAINKFVSTEIVDNLEMIINIMNVSNTPLLFLASISYTMMCKHVSSEVIADTINDINNSIEHSFSQADLDQFILTPFRGV